MNKNASERPRSFSDNQLRKVGVEIVDLSSGMCGCVECGQRWLVNQPSKYSRRLRGYWKCPNGCNTD